MRHFYLSHLTTVIGLILAFTWDSWHGVGIAALLMIMEVTLSFDNAVVNATVLKEMTPKWQQRFLTWGMLVAVFGMRLLFPIAVVSFATHLSLMEVTHLALRNPDEYSKHVLASHVDIASFGGMFLLMVFLSFIFDEFKELHWLGKMEEKLSKLGKMESVEVVLALCVLLLLQGILPPEEELEALTSGIIGVALYVAVHSATALMAGKEAGTAAAKSVAFSGVMGFIYLQILDASFSLDGVIGAFAISVDIVIIMIGLGIGAMFVRSLTVYMVRKGTLDHYVYLEHGAHYGIGALAAIMLISMVTPVSEIITGLVGVLFILLSLVSSIRYNRKHSRVAKS